MDNQVDDDVEIVLRLLEDANFQRIQTPLATGGATFKFDAAATGAKASHALVLVSKLNGSSDQPSRLLSRLALTLDRLRSKRPISLILIGERPERSELAKMERLARVLIVETNNPTAEQLRKAVAVLLPIENLEFADAPKDLLHELDEAVPPESTSAHESLLEEAQGDIDKIKAWLEDYLNKSYDGELVKV